MCELTQERLKELLHYCPDSGEFSWLQKTRPQINIGDKAGSIANTDGYVRIKINKKLYLAHRLAFLYMDGRFPPEQVDHINRSESDNKWANLRPSTASENQCNKGTNNPFIGVYWHKKSRAWVAKSRMINGVSSHLGSYKTNLAACYARHAYEVLL